MTTLFEYEVDAQEATRAEIAAFRRLRGKSGADVLDLTVRGDGGIAFQATQYVGVIRLAGRTIQVLPKIYGDGRDDAQRRAIASRNLLYLLELAGDLSIQAHEHAKLLSSNADWFEILTHLFASRLRDEWSRGAWRTYTRVEEDASPVLKGKWRINIQLRRPEQRHCFAVSHDEFEADNALNRVLRFVVERLWRCTSDAGNRRVLNDLRTLMDEVTCPLEVSGAEAGRVVLTRMNARFGPLLKLARLFLEGRAVQLNSGLDDTFAFMFDMNRLFEGLVSRLLLRELRDAWAARGWTLHLQQAKQSLLVDEDGRVKVSLRPDIRFEDAAERTVLIVDTKYKRLDGVAGVKDGDAYQMFAYAARYECPRVVVMYPGLATDRWFAKDGGMDPWLYVCSVSLHRDLSSITERAALGEQIRRVLFLAESFASKGGQGVGSG